MQKRTLMRQIYFPIVKTYYTVFIFNSNSFPPNKKNKLSSKTKNNPSY